MCADDAACRSGKCLADLPAGGYCYSEGCNESSNPCPTGAKCISVSEDGEAACFKACTTNNDCRAGHICRPEEGVCFVEPTQAEGQDCGGKEGLCVDELVCVPLSEDGPGRCMATCTDGGEPCSGGKECVSAEAGGDGICLPPATAQEGDDCDAVDRRCVDGFVCVRFSETEGACATRCELGGGGCADGEECVELSGGAGACAPPAGVAAGGECGRLDQRCTGELLCVGFEGGGRLCLPPCKPSEGDAACDAGRCLPLMGDDDDSGACLVPGEVAIGETCGGDITQRCVADAICLIQNEGDETGTCRGSCDKCGHRLLPAAQRRRRLCPVERRRRFRRRVRRGQPLRPRPHLRPGHLPPALPHRVHAQRLHRGGHGVHAPRRGDARRRGPAGRRRAVASTGQSLQHSTPPLSELPTGWPS
jgi:hypothetical protein